MYVRLFGTVNSRVCLFEAHWVCGQTVPWSDVASQFKGEINWLVSFDRGMCPEQVGRAGFGGCKLGEEIVRSAASCTALVTDTA